MIIYMLALAVALAGVARAESCIDYGDYLHWAGILDMPDDPGNVVVEGQYAYVSCGSVLQVLDISNPGAPIAVGTVSTPGGGRALTVAGDYAYVAGGYLNVVDISDPEAPTCVGRVDTRASASGVAVAGHHAYVAAWDSPLRPYAGVEVVDVSNPESPVIVGGVSTSSRGRARDVVVVGEYAYVTDSSQGLLVFDISTPASPQMRYRLETPGAANDLAVAVDRYLYVADGLSGLHVVDITFPTVPRIIGSVDSPIGVTGVAVAGRYVYLGGVLLPEPPPGPLLLTGCLQVVDVSNASYPHIVGTIKMPGDLSVIERVAVGGDHVYAAGGRSVLQIVSVLHPSSPSLVGSADTPDEARCVAVDRDYAYLACSEWSDPGHSSLQVLDISTPATPAIVGDAETPGQASAVVLAGDYAYVADGSSGLQVLDISNPDSPPIVGSVGTQDWAYCVAVAGDFAYVGTGGTYGWLQVVNIADPTAPAIIWSVDTPGDVMGVALVGHYALVANGGYGLQVVDIEDPAAPVIVGDVDTPGNACDVVVAGEHAYVADGGSGLQVVDITDPAAPLVIGGVDTPDDACDVIVVGEYAYLADSDFGMQVVDVSSPSSPVLVGGANTPGAARGVVVAGDYVYVADAYGGLIVCPTHCESPSPVELSRFELVSDDGTVTITWQTSFEADHLGFHIYRAENGGNRFERVNDELIRGGGDRRRGYEFVDRMVTTGETYAYRLLAVDTSGGTQTFSLGSVRVEHMLPTNLVLHQNRPNPFNPSTSIAFELPGAAHVTLRIYEISGRLVNTLVDGRCEAGNHSVVWSGRDQSGRPLVSGVYAYRLEIGDRAMSRMLVLAR
jgi:hypothetical protein